MVVRLPRKLQFGMSELLLDFTLPVVTKEGYFGYKLVMLCTVEGLPIAYDLVPANTDERQAVEAVLSQVVGSDVYGDKGFIGQDWQEQIHRSTGNRIWTIHRQSPTLPSQSQFEAFDWSH